MKNDRYFGMSKRIATWKADSDFESMLADCAENSHLAKSLYAAYYKHLNPDYYNKGREFALTLYNNHSSDFKEYSFDIIYEDMVYCLHKYGLSFQDYCIYNLIDKSESCRKKFVSDKLRYYYCDILNAHHVENMMTNKFTCYQKYAEFFKREIISVAEASDKPRFLSFIRKHEEFIYKPLNEHSGHGIQKITAKNMDLDKWFDKMISEQPGIIEELIHQGDKMNLLNASSINSCRIVTFTIGTDVKIIGGALRMGVGHAFTDNAGAGGIYASIEPETGLIQSDAKNYLNQHFKYHPTTHTPIIGFQLPEWDKAKELVSRMATHIHGTTLISWDIAFSTNGWCMVEANDNGDWSIIQSNLEIGKKDELYRLMDCYFANKK